MALILILFPLGIAGLALVIPGNRLRPWLLPVAALVHTAVTLLLIRSEEYWTYNSWLLLDPLSALILITVSGLFLLSAFYAVGYLHHRLERSNRFFVASLSASLGLISLAIWSHHMGLMWVAIEGTTLVTAPLIYFNKSKQSIEATWKYLLLSSVGIALALLGTFFLAYAAIAGSKEASLDFATLLQTAPHMSSLWLRSAFILLLVGYGTKMGLAPMHTWKPDAYGEAPGVVGAILAGGVTSGAFLALLRMYQITLQAGEKLFMSRLLVLIGIFSMLVAAIFMINQRDFKRMLAYSSVEHMGILVLGVGLGGRALWGALFHVILNAFTKGTLFLSAGNIHRAYKDKSTDAVQGAYRRLPLSASLFLVSFLAITGSPPFGPFISEFSILSGAFGSGHYVVGFLFLLLLLVVFIGMGITVLKVVQGKVPSEVEHSEYQDSFLTAAPPLAFLLVVLFLGVYVPPFLRNLISQAVSVLGSNL